MSPNSGTADHRRSATDRTAMHRLAPHHRDVHLGFRRIDKPKMIIHWKGVVRCTTLKRKGPAPRISARAQTGRIQLHLRIGRFDARQHRHTHRVIDRPRSSRASVIGVREILKDDLSTTVKRVLLSRTATKPRFVFGTASVTSTQTTPLLVWPAHQAVDPSQSLNGRHPAPRQSRLNF